MTASKTAKKSLEVPGMCSAGSCDVEDRPVVLGGAGAVGGGTEGDNLELKSSPPPPLELATHPKVDPLQNHHLPPPTGVKEMRVA